jgi:DNA-binding transcriptional ArsR family regulator
MNDQDATENLLVALRHPVRREILAKVIEGGEPISPKELAESLKTPLSNLSYHARVLVECDMLDLVDTRPRRGSIQHFYEASELIEHPMVKAALGLNDAGGA